MTFANRHQYCDLVEKYRLHEFDRQAAAIRHGLASIVPVHLLSFFSWDQLERMVCGDNIMDIALLKSMTTYSSCSESDPHVKNLWTLLEDEFTEEEKTTFLRFVWGRSRLPLTKEAFPRKFKIQAFTKSPADKYLPQSHTCFASLELPQYSSLDGDSHKGVLGAEYCSLHLEIVDKRCPSQGRSRGD